MISHYYAPTSHKIQLRYTFAVSRITTLPSPWEHNMESSFSPSAPDISCKSCKLASPSVHWPDIVQATRMVRAYAHEDKDEN